MLSVAYRGGGRGGSCPRGSSLGGAARPEEKIFTETMTAVFAKCIITIITKTVILAYLNMATKHCQFIGAMTSADSTAITHYALAR